MATITTSVPLVIWPVTQDGKTIFDQKNDALPPQLQALADDSAAFATQANALRDEVNGFQQTASAQAVAAANSASSASSSASSAQAALSDTQSVIALAETVPFTLTSGDDFDSLSKVWPLIRTAFETNSLPWKPIVNLDFARDNYEAYVGLSAGTTRAPLLDLATFSRASSATGVNAFGNVETVGANQPRIVFENGVAKGVLLEGTATNLLTWSEDFANWTYSAPYSVSSDFTESPEDGLFADLLIVSSGQSSFSANVPKLTVAKTAEPKTYTHSCYFKSSGDSATHVRISNFGLSTLDSVSVIVSLVDGSVVSAPSTIGGFSNASVKVETASKGFFKVELTFTTDAHTALTVRAFPYNGLNAFTGDGINGLIAWGAKLEQSSTPSSYIKTEDTSVVRAADSFRYTLPSYSGSFSEFSFFVDFVHPEDNGTIQIIASFGDSTSNEFRIEFFGSSLRTMVDTGAGDVNDFVSTRLPSTKSKALVRFTKNSADYTCSVFLNGVNSVNFSLATIPDPSIWGVGDRSTGTNGLYSINSTISKFAIFPTALPDVVCQAITGV